MPGPLSEPLARQGNHLVSGKTALRKAGLKSREGMGERDWGSTPRPARRTPQVPKDRDAD